MATEQKKILIRRGNKADLVVADLQPGEPVLALDTNEVGVKTSGGAVLWFATLNAQGKVIQDPASYGQPNGVASLGADSKLAMGQTPTADTIVGGLHQINVTMAAGWTKDGITLYKYGRIIWGLVAIQGPVVAMNTTIFKIPTNAAPVRSVRISANGTSGIVINDSDTNVKAMYNNMGSMYHTVMWLSA